MPSRRQSVFVLIGFLAITSAVAAFGSQFSPGPWYAQLQKPAWNPPNWIFGPVWTALYIMMAVAAWMVWRTDAQTRRRALVLYFAQLLLNGAWSWLFFGLERPGVAFVEIVILWLAIAATLAAFWRIRAAAGALLVPYLLWVTFATFLNFTLWRMNA